MVSKRSATPDFPTNPFAILFIVGQSSWKPLAWLFVGSHTADHTPEPPPTSSQLIGPAFAIPRRSAAICATGQESEAIAGTRMLQNSLSGTSVWFTVGFPV